MKYLFFILFSILLFTCYHRTTTTNLDFKVFHQASVRVVNHQNDLYDFNRDQIFTYKYSPVFPLMVYPFGYLSEPSARKVWALLNMMLFPLAWYILVQIYLLITKEPKIAYSNMLITLALLAQPLTNNATQGNINTILLAFIAGSYYFSLKNKQYLSGILSAIGFSIKLTPGVIFIYFICYKKWKELIFAAVTSFILMIIIPVICFGFHETINLYMGWKTVLSDTSHFPFFKYTNQSPLVIMSHLQGLDSINLISKIFYYGVNLAMTGAFYYFYKRKNVLAFISLTFMFLLTASPVVWMEYYIFLLFPYLVIHQWLVDKLLLKTSYWIWIVKLLVVHLFVKFIIGNTYSDIIAYYGRSFFGLVMLFIIFYLEDRKRIQIS